MRELLPLFLDLTGRDVLLVGGGPVAAGKLQQLLAAGATFASSRRGASPKSPPAPNVQIARPQIPIVRPRRCVARRRGGDAATSIGEVAEAAEERRVFVNAVDDPPNATAYLSGVVRRDERNDCDFDRRRRAGPDRADPRSTARGLAVTTLPTGCARPVRDAANGVATECQWKRANRCY